MGPAWHHADLLLVFYQAMDRELCDLKDQLEKQRQNAELERQHYEEKARELEHRERTLAQEKEEKARVSEGEVGHKRGRDCKAPKERAPAGTRAGSGEFEMSGKEVCTEEEAVRIEVKSQRSAGRGSGNRGEVDGHAVRGERRGDHSDGGGEAEATESCIPGHVGGASDWSVMIEDTDRSAVLTNTSAERLRVVKALLSGW